MDRFERIKAAIALDAPDRIPVMPIMSAFAARQAGIKQAEAWGDPERAFQAFLHTFQELEHCDMLARTVAPIAITGAGPAWQDHRR